jgi:hypothetical protein
MRRPPILNPVRAGYQEETGRAEGALAVTVESQNDFQEPCPWCGSTLSDRTAPEQDGGYWFYRIRFECEACDYWFCTRREHFNVLGPARDAAFNPIPLPPEADQRVRLDLTQVMVRHYMPEGVESYELGAVRTTDDGVLKTFSQFAVIGVQVALAHLSQQYLEQGDREAGLRALEMAVEEIHTLRDYDPSLAEFDPELREVTTRILVAFADFTEGEGRTAEAEELRREAEVWAIDSPE